ncbi:hypothetical protein [Bradyrhizobium sp. HKCCYLR1051]|uniref:hypothetical protein n=1 Tax=Bradyrhizobium sp. HKCCYLR1051 TaxID=3420738 RepID=UPI003EBC257F
MTDRIQIALDLIAKLLGAEAPDHAAHVETFRAARLRALDDAPALDWPGLLITLPAQVT